MTYDDYNKNYFEVKFSRPELVEFAISMSGQEYELDELKFKIGVIETEEAKPHFKMESRAGTQNLNLE